MSLKLSILALFRSPMKTIIAFALLVATSFAFVSRGAEYFTTERAIDAVVREYTAVGTLVATEEKYEEHFGISAERSGSDTASLAYYSPIDEEAVDLLLGSDYVASSETRHVAGGISEERRSVMEQPVGTGDDNANRLALDEAIVIAECIDVIDNYFFTNPNPRLEIEVDWESGMLFTVEEVLAGDAEQYGNDAAPHYYYHQDSSTIHKTYREDSPIFAIEFDYDSPLRDTFVAGHRYVLSLSPDRANGERAKKLTESAPYTLFDLTLIEEENGSVGYEDYVHILESRYGRITEVNHRKQELVYTADMSMLPRFHDGTLYMTDGRMIAPEDTGDVCVINADYANENGIRIGDTISFTVDPNTMVYAGEVFARELHSPKTYALGARYSRHEQTPVAKSYEVVGIWASQPNGSEVLSVSDADNYDPDALAYPLNTVFVPASTYPWADEINPHSFPSTFSFMLAEPGDKRSLELELGDKLRELGYELVIDDMGYAVDEASYMTLRTGALIGLVAMSTALLLSLILVTYLFMTHGKVEYELVREHGIPAERASRLFLLELLVLAAAAVVISCVISMFTIRGYATELAASMAEIIGKTVSVTYSPWLIPLLGVGVLALLMLSALGLYTVGRSSAPKK